MKPTRFLWTAHPLRALLETWIIGLAILFVLSRQVGIVSPYVLGNGVLFLCGVCGMWAVLRTRLPRGSWWQQGLWELAVGLALSLMMAAGLGPPARFLGWEDVWLGSSLRGFATASLLLLGTGPGYVAARGGVRLWLLWDRLRRRRMLWAITHAHLMLVVLLACIGALAIFLLSSFSGVKALSQPGAASLFTSIADHLLRTIFPAISMVTVLTLITLLILLPPSALFSFLVARRTTRRLETLANAARALREGRYGARVAVSGEDEVAQLQADFNAMADDLERTLRDLETQRDTIARLLQNRRELVAAVSHELRTPVATVRATLESTLERSSETPPGSLRHDLQVANDEVLRLQGLIDDLLALSQVEAGGLVLDCRPTDVIPIVQRTVEALASLAWSAGRVEVVSDLPPSLPSARVDEARLQQILANLLRNAIRHTPPGGIVAAIAREEPEALVVHVRDTGEGIAPEALPHIWERFYRGESSRARDEGGVGLGLALVKELTEAMGGTVAAESAPGQGSCFTVRLPRA